MAHTLGGRWGRHRRQQPSPRLHIRLGLQTGREYAAVVLGHPVWGALSQHNKQRWVPAREFRFPEATYWSCLVKHVSSLLCLSPCLEQSPVHCHPFLYNC